MHPYGDLSIERTNYMATAAPWVKYELDINAEYQAQMACARANSSDAEAKAMQALEIEHFHRNQTEGRNSTYTL